MIENQLEKKSKVRVLETGESLRRLPRVIMNYLIFQKIKCFVDLCDHEISGFGIIERAGNDFIVSDVFLLEQTTAADSLHVDMDSKALNLFIYEMVKKGGDPSEVRFQWHSHADGQTFFSSEDISTIAGYMNDFMISLVMNKSGKYKCRLDLFKPFHLSLEVPVLLRLSPPPDKLVGHCQEEIRRLVTVKASKFGIPVSKQASAQDDGYAGTISVLAENFLKEGGEEDNELPETDGLIES